MKVIHLSIFLILFQVNGWTQNGFLGKKTQIEASFLANTPILSGAFKKNNYFKRGETLIPRRDYLDYGFNLQATWATSKRHSLGANVILKQFEVFSDSIISDNFSNALIGNFEITSKLKMESVRFRCFSFLPLLTIAPKDGYTGVGISYDFGIGYSLSHIANKDYYTIANSPENSPGELDVYRLSTDWRPLHSLTFRYGTHLLIPITPSIHYKIGFISLVNVYYNRVKFIEMNEYVEDVFNYEDLYYSVQRENLFTWNINTGILLQL